MSFPKSDVPQKTHECPACKVALERLYSKKKSKHYWHCPECESWFSEKNGAPMLDQVERGEPDPNVKCPDCQAPMRKISGTKSGPFHSCSRYPDCKGTVDIQDDGSLAPICTEDASHGHMRRHKGQNGPFWGCRRYPDCSAVMNIGRAAK
jgi:ssDNA-binding Zn-finger/Zn-ribbon topoisomerase 1